VSAAEHKTFGGRLTIPGKRLKDACSVASTTREVAQSMRSATQGWFKRPRTVSHLSARVGNALALEMSLRIQCTPERTKHDSYIHH